MTLWTDGGGKATAALRPISGAERVAAFIIGIMRKFPSTFGQQHTLVNGQPGFVIRVERGDTAVLTLDVADGQIWAIRVVANPEKLRALLPAAEHPRAP